MQLRTGSTRELLQARKREIEVIAGAITTHRMSRTLVAGLWEAAPPKALQNYFPELVAYDPATTFSFAVKIWDSREMLWQHRFSANRLFSGEDDVEHP